MKFDLRKWRPNFFDIIIVCIGIVIVLVVYWISRPTTVSSATIIPLEYIVELNNLPEGTSSYVKVGDVVTESVKNMNMGTVKAVKTVPYTIAVNDEARGIVVQAPVAGYESVQLTIESNMTITDRAVTTDGGYVVRVGAQARVKGPCYAGSGFVIEMERQEDAVQ